MAETYTVTMPGVVFANAKSMASIWNPLASSQSLYIRRIWFTNNNYTAVTGVVTEFRLYRINARGGAGTSVTPVSHDTTNTAVDANILFEYNATVTNSECLFKWMTSGEEVVSGGATVSQLVAVPIYTLVWDAGYGDANVSPLRIRGGQDPGEGISIYCATNTTAGYYDTIIEFTII